MKVAKDTFLIQVHSDRNSDIGIIGANGSPITIDTDYNKYKHTVQVGRIYACPIMITDQYSYDTPLQVNDQVVFHHFVCQPDHKVAENIYRAEYFHVYAKIENDIIMPIEDAIFVIPLLEDEESMYVGKIRIKAFQENVKQQGLVFAASKKAQAAGVHAGDKVFFTANADYSMKVIDKDVYRMRIRNIVAIERNGELVCLAGKVLVKEDPQERMIGRFSDVRGGTQMTGIVIAAHAPGIKPGERIAYYAGTTGSIDYDGSRYGFIELRHINYVIEN